jgi:tRNA modification GTPase TrmE
MNNKSITAISTPPGVGAISCVRLSGENCIAVADKVFRGKTTLKNLAGYTATPGKIEDNGEMIDQVVALVYHAPNSFTGENMVEIFCHGSPVVAEKILRLLCKNGAEIAAPGEFTKRAFLSGKIDLTGAAGVADMIAAENDLAVKNAAALLDGAAFKEISEIAESLTALLAQLDASIDYSDDEELSALTLPKADLDKTANRLKTLLDSYDIGKLVTSGVTTTIAGKPNVGKSTVMNLLLGESRSIVTDVAGTTRDVISDTLRLKNCTLLLSDTAGIRNTENLVESIGINRAKKSIESAELVLLVLDASRPLDKDDFALLDLTKNKTTLIITNKIDIKSTDFSEFHNRSTNAVSTISISANDKSYGPQLAEKIEQTLNLNKAANYDFMLSSERQRSLVARAYDSLQNIDTNNTADLIAADIDTALSALLELTGKRVSETVINEIFSKFCVGK